MDGKDDIDKVSDNWPRSSTFDDDFETPHFMREVIELTKARSRKRLYGDDDETQERTEEDDTTSSKSEK